MDGSQDAKQGSQPHLAATFYPGGVDDFYIPEVVSPAPQRSRPEVPSQMQNNIACLEMDGASSLHSSGSQSQGSSYKDQVANGPYETTSRRSQFPPQGHQNQSNEFEDARLGNATDVRPPVSQLDYAPTTLEQPSFSPFPIIQNRPANVPPSDDEKENILETAREAVLNSNDPEMQLTWAQDALGYVEVAMENERRLSDVQKPRSTTPRVEHQLRVDAINVVSFLADQHHPRAEFMRGTWLEFGKFNFRMDKKDAYRCYSRAAQGGYARAEYRMGMQFESSNDIAKAIKHYTLGEKGHDSASYYRLGMMTLLGQHGQPQDYRRGVELIKLSADTADENAPQGAYVYGMLQARELPQVSIPDHFLPLNLEGALYNIEKAAYLGFAKAQTKMGAAYELCQLGCSFDPALSLHYNNLAARQGEPEAEMAISKWFLSGHEGVFKKNDELAFIYAQRAAQTGLATAEFAMGYFYEIGIHVSVSLKEAQSWYGKAAEHGNKDAAARIEGITRSKTLSRKDHEKVAVAKITSSRGSQYGNRPERFTRPAVAVIPSISSGSYNTVSMPEVGPRYSSRTHGTPYTQPITTVSSPASAFTSPAMPSLSTFPQNSGRTTPATSMGGYPATGYPQMMPPLATGIQRPHSSTGEERTAVGRGLPGHQALQPGQIPQGYRQSSMGLPPSPASSRPPFDPRQKPLPAVDIGFSAPPDPSGDRKKRYQISDVSNGAYPPSGRGYMGRPDRVSSRPQMAPHSNTYNGSGRVPSPHTGSASPALGNRPPRQESLPVRPHPGASNPTSSATPPPSSLGNNSPAPSSGAAPTIRRTGKGPATFEEMGVPQSKKEDDCIIM